MYGLLFVYGLLRHGFRMHELMEGSRFLGLAWLPGYSMRELGGYPGIVPDPRGYVVGEVYEVPLSLLPRLDEAEDVEGGLYRRELVRAYMGLPGDERFPVEAWAYIYTGREGAGEEAPPDYSLWRLGASSAVAPLFTRYCGGTVAVGYEWVGSRLVEEPAGEARGCIRLVTYEEAWSAAATRGASLAAVVAFDYAGRPYYPLALL